MQELDNQTRAAVQSGALAVLTLPAVGTLWESKDKLHGLPGTFKIVRSTIYPDLVAFEKVGQWPIAKRKVIEPKDFYRSYQMVKEAGK